MLSLAEYGTTQGATLGQESHDDRALGLIRADQIFILFVPSWLDEVLSSLHDFVLTEMRKGKDGNLARRRA